jgi:hypothetical protein
MMCSAVCKTNITRSSDGIVEGGVQFTGVERWPEECAGRAAVRHLEFHRVVLLARAPTSKCPRSLLSPHPESNETESTASV